MTDTYSAADWERAAAAVLRKSRRLGEDDADASVWPALTRTTLDDIAVTPLGLPENTPDDPGLRPSRHGGWDIRGLLEVGADAGAKASETALVDLQNGVTSLWLQPADAGDVAAALDGVLLDLAPVVLDAPADPVVAARAYVDALGETTPAEGTNLGADPIGAAVRGVEQAEGVLTALADLARERGVLAAVVDATAVHDRGASDAQELGYALAVGTAYLRELTDHGLSVDDAASLLEFRFAATDEQFPTIAKLRAARRLWARVLEVSGASAADSSQRQHVVTSRPMMTAYDPWVNMLRTTVAAFAAGVGGADAVTVLPFDTRLGVSDAFARRIARNTSSLLIAESHLGKVADPAGGSYLVEQVTASLVDAAWAEFERIEESGGVRAAWTDGSLPARIDAVVARRDAEIADRRRPITGVTEFPHLGEQLPTRAPHPTESPVRPYAAAFEALRDDPVEGDVYLATLGPVAQHTARATFAANLFAAGGIATTPAGATASIEDVVAGYAGQRVVCLAGSDASYAEWGEALLTALRDAGAGWIVLAGRTDLPVDDTCAMGVDALAFLTRTREVLA